MSSLFLGLDCSTQSLTGIIIDFEAGAIIHTESVVYDEDLPQYKTQNGVLYLKNEKEVHSSPLMWLDALDLLFSRLEKANVPLQDIKAISGSGQQHGTVYLNDQFVQVISNLDVNKPLSKQFSNTLSRKTSPIWMDSSTTQQCQEIRDKLGGMENTIKLTGSNTFERFSGPQIRKFYQQEPKAYEETSIIHLVSSFLASILLGKNAGIDHGDGSGMNLMNIKSKTWDDEALGATAPRLKVKLPPLINPYDILGPINPYFAQKYHLSPETQIVAWSGDNPNSLIGLGLFESGKVAISLGTSDTYFSHFEELSLDLSGEGHVFVAPTGDYMSLICYKNGSLAREKIRDQFGLDWNTFSKVLSRTEPGNKGRIMLPYVFPEIVPLVLEPKVHRFGFDEDDMKANVRGIIEGQFLSMRLHSQWIKEKPKEISITGGASANKQIMQIIADIFDTNVRYYDITDSAALGAALRAAKSFHDHQDYKTTWEETIFQFLNSQRSHGIKPNPKNRDLYDDLLVVYQKCEENVLRNGVDPETFRKIFIKKYSMS